MSVAEANQNKGLDRSAILLMTLDEDIAAEVFKHMAQDDVQALVGRMAGLSHLSGDQVSAVMREFNDELDQYGAVNLNAREHIQAVLVKALGKDRASGMLEDIFETGRGSGIESLNTMEANVVAEMIRDEHPQIIATILVHLDRPLAAQTLQHFEEELRNNVVLRVATFSGVQPAALKELTESLSSLMDGSNLKRSKMGGISTAAEMLNLMNTTQEQSVLAGVRAHDEALASRIHEQMFVFDDLASADDTTIRRVLQELDNNTLAIALKGADQALVDRFTANMAKRAAELLLEDMQMRGPTRLSQVDAERKNILAEVRRLADAGEIALSSEDDEYV